MSTVAHRLLGRGRRATGHDPHDASPSTMGVVDMDLARPWEFRSPDGDGQSHPALPFLALVRMHGHPLGLVVADGERCASGGPGQLWRSVADMACQRFAVPLARHLAADGAPQDGPPTAPGARRARPLCPSGAARQRALGSAPPISVIVATRGRSEPVRRCLTSLLRMDYSRFEVIVVDSAPADATERLVKKGYGRRVRYLREPGAGPGRAHHGGLAAAHGRIAALIDDDTLVDPGWLSAIAESFAQDPSVTCVAGLIIPTEVTISNRAALEHRGPLGSGFAPHTWSLEDPVADPASPFTAGHLGSDRNIAFRVDDLLLPGGLPRSARPRGPSGHRCDPIASLRRLTTGRSLTYQPDAVVWHRRGIPGPVDDR